jgi:hypothetical protein
MENKKISNNDIKENRSFGLVLIILLLITYVLTDGLNFYGQLFFVILFLVITLITFYIPRILKKPYGVWMKFGFLLGNITSFIVLSIIFLCVFFPIGTVLRLFNVLSIKVNYDKNINSYWIKRSEPIQSLKQQF